MCLDCARDRDAERRKRDKATGKKKSVKSEQLIAADTNMRRKSANIVEQVDARGNMSGPIRYEYLAPRGAALEALTKLNKAMEEVRTKCFDKPEEYIDWDEDSPPSNRQAQLLCSGCPVARLCEDYGRKSRDRGVWGGTVILDNGKIQR